ncbi:hypothetical protein HQ587_11495 [bacterium]|nr:hypothetical protein [bacterium]
MRRAFAILLIGMFCFTSIASATRTTTMGNANHILKDSRNIWILPSTLAMYPNLMKAEINVGNGLYEVGGHYDMGKCVMALYFNNVDRGYQYAPTVPWQPGYDQKIDLFLAKSLDEMTAFGLQLSLYGNSYKADGDADDPIPEDKTETALTGFGLNLGATIIENLELSLTINMVSWTDKGLDGEDQTKSDGYVDFGLGGRFWMEMSDSYTLIPYMNFIKIGQGYTVENVPSDAPDGTPLGSTTKGIYFMLGAGNNMNVSDNVLAIVDIGLLFWPLEAENSVKGSKETTKYPYTIFPNFGLGLEAQIKDWLDIRIGANKGWIKEGYEPEEPTGANPEETYGYASEVFYLGAGFHFGELDIDVQINPDLVLNGPHFVSGVASSMATMATLTYTFDK